MFWPFDRLRTYSPGTPVHADDLNELQDAVVYQRHGEIQAPISLALPTAGWTYDTTGWRAPSAGGRLYLSIPFPRGSDLLTVTAYWNMSSIPFNTADQYDYLNMSIEHTDPFVDSWMSNLSSPIIANTSTGDHSGQRVRYTWDLRANPVRLQPGRLYRLWVSVGKAARRVDGVMATLARS